MKNIRATPYKVGGDEFRALELYVASRGNGLSAETPSVRNLNIPNNLLHQ